MPIQFCCRSGIKCFLGPVSPYTGKVMSVADYKWGASQQPYDSLGGEGQGDIMEH